MNIAERIALELASTAPSLKKTDGLAFRTAPRSAGVLVTASVVYRLADRGLLKFLHTCKRVAVITDAGRAALGGDA